MFLWCHCTTYPFHALFLRISFIVLLFDIRNIFLDLRRTSLRLVAAAAAAAAAAAVAAAADAPAGRLDQLTLRYCRF